MMAPACPPEIRPRPEQHSMTATLIAGGANATDLSYHLKSKSMSDASMVGVGTSTRFLGAPGVVLSMTA
jgi:hypothetical protein